jgi:hypothetical protein
MTLLSLSNWDGIPFRRAATDRPSGHRAKRGAVSRR